MKFKEFVENLNKLLEERPETANFDVVTSDNYQYVWYYPVDNPPDLGEFDLISRDFDENGKPNAVCVN